MRFIGKITFLLLISFGFISIGFSQTDTLKTEKKNKKAIYRQARIASVMSAVIPGSGQIYNRKYWKAPIVYAALGGFGYLLAVNQQKYTYYGKNLKYEYDGYADTKNETGYSGTQLQTLKAEYRKKRDLGIIGCLAIYALNIIDANVDAHLRTFDVSDDLSLQIKPYSNIYTFNNSISVQSGLTLNFNFK